MSLQSGSHDPWIGQLVWFFPRNEAGLPIGNSAICGIVIDREYEGVYVVMHGGERIIAWEADMEPVEVWDEE